MPAFFVSRRAIARRNGFTLVELLVVIGIIGLLIGILLPTLNKAKEKSRQIKCMSNIRQITMAAIMFATEHNDYMPARASGTIYVFDPISGDAPVPATVPALRAGLAAEQLDDSDYVKLNLADWIAWRRHKDPVTGEVNTAANQNITYSGLAPYLGSKLNFTPPGDYDAANRANEKLDQVFRCPSDQIERRPSHNDPSHGYYRYSYAMSTAYSWPVYTFPQEWPGRPPFRPGERVDGFFNGKKSSIKNAASKVLFICQDEKTIDDGAYNPRPFLWFERGNDSRILDVVSARHTKANAKANSKNANGGNNSEGYEDVLGNVGFADGHGDFFSRKDALRSKHSGNPNRDPPNF